MFSSIAFFGATGGCVCKALSLAITNKIHSVALVRDPTKLINMLQQQHNISQSQIDSYLTIIKGSIYDHPQVKLTLTINNKVPCVQCIVSGIGSTPKFQASIKSPVTLVDPDVCNNATRVLLETLTQLQNETNYTPPQIVAISTTGITHGHRDVPILFLPLYHWLLAVPHQDKAAMEDQLLNADSKVVSGVCIVRPSLLTDGESRGVSRVRYGVGEDSPAVGYVISREDVGAWVYEKVIAGSGFERTVVTLTY